MWGFLTTIWKKTNMAIKYNVKSFSRKKIAKTEMELLKFVKSKLYLNCALFKKILEHYESDRWTDVSWGVTKQLGYWLLSKKIHCRMYYIHGTIKYLY